MPITYNRETGFQIENPTPEELVALQEIGKAMIVEGLAGAYMNEKYKKYLAFAPTHQFWKV